MKFIDLCAGTGAFTYVLNKKKFTCVMANDKNKSSEIIYNSNFNCNTFKLKDINDIKVEDIPSFDILTAGFPCQPFSIAGRQNGFNDLRSNVFWKIINILNFHKPSIILLENVKNLKNHDNGNTFKIIEKELKKLKYFIKYKVLNTSELTGIPHNRERIYIVGFLDKNKHDKFNFNFKSKKKNNITKYLEKKINDKYYYTDRFVVYDKIKNNVIKNISTNTLYQYRRFYVRENKNNCCPTLTANMGSGGHNVPLLKDNKGIRKLTPRECFNLQGFPKKYILPKLSDSKLYKLSGNAVSIPIVELIVNRIFN